MKKTTYNALVFASALLFVSSGAVAAECSGAWSVLPNYAPGSGGACAALGLNTYQAVCLPNQRYAAYCDDTSGGQYRICQSNISCIQEKHDGYSNRGFRDYSRYSGGDRWCFHDNRRDERYGRRGGPRRYRDEHREGW